MAAYPGVRMPTFTRVVPPGPRLRILDSYILREVAAPFWFALAAFFLFWFANIFVLAADYLVNKGAPFFLVLRFLLFRVPQATPLAFPFACLFGTLLGMGRLAADNEITALRTSGVSFFRIIRLPLIAGAAVAVISFLINEHIAPVATDLSTRSFYQILYRSQTLPVEPNIFRSDPTTGNTFYIQSVSADGRTMQNVQIYEPARTTPFIQLLTAKRARIEGTEIVLEHAIQTRINADGQVSAVDVTAKEVRISLPMGDNGQNFLSSAFNDTYTMNTQRLAQDIKFRKQTGQGGTDLAVRELTLSSKYAYPFAAFIAVIIALPLAVKFGKNGRTIGIVLSIIALFVYYALVALFGAFGKNGAIDPYLAAWIPNILIGSVGGFLVWREDR
ncbi:MAG: LptF/LptG family permease [Candidatus Eremiobacteraeota bacterium]|nr:LptF/LptG family permease [Candidatus Eremiobacteraeota bacterium]MBV8749283.1 LptF/LptG family permease [Candidatus Eremiobacteraeota bacterium]MBV9409542.1 LptF/LptG family permease [Candidatus Eremiobacteraeota bacterium]